MLRIGLVGINERSEEHLKELVARNQISLNGYLSEDDQPIEVYDRIGIPLFKHPDELIPLVDICLCSTLSEDNYQLIEHLMKAGKHILIDLPIYVDISISNGLMKTAKESNVTCKICNIHYFNPAFISTEYKIKSPLYIESHRLEMYGHRDYNLDVVQDLMLYDIQLILKLVNSDVKHLSATGVKVLTPTIDIANARLEFSNGTIANLTSSRISQKNMSKMRIFQKDCYHVVNFLQNKSELVSLNAKEDIPSYPNRNLLQVYTEINPDKNAYQLLYDSFFEQVTHKSSDDLSIEKGYQAMDIAHKIVKRINSLGED